MAETTTHSCDVCGKSGLERWAFVEVTNSHFGRDAFIWPPSDQKAVQCCSVDCVRKAAAKLAGAPFTAEQLRSLAEQRQPDIASELGAAQGRIRGLEAQLAAKPGPAADHVVTRRELGDLLREALADRRRIEASEDRLHGIEHPRPRDDWHEDDGPVLWWKLPVSEPPYAGTPLDDDFPEYVTHWTRCPELRDEVSSG